MVLSSLKMSSDYDSQPIQGLHRCQNFVLHLFVSIGMLDNMSECALHLGLLKENQNNIFQKLHTKKDLKKSAFANALSRSLFEWIQNLTQNCVEIILSGHSSFTNNFLIVFLHFLRKCFGYQAVFQSHQPNSLMKSQHKGLVYSSHEYNLNKVIAGF